MARRTGSVPGGTGQRTGVKHGRKKRSRPRAGTRKAADENMQIHYISKADRVQYHFLRGAGAKFPADHVWEHFLGRYPFCIVLLCSKGGGAMKCTGEDCTHCTRPASKCQGCGKNHKTAFVDGTQPTRKAPGKPDKTAVHLVTRGGKDR